MTDKPTTRKDLMKPVQLLGLAFVAALFAGFVTLMSMGFFQTRPANEIQNALIVALVAAGAVQQQQRGAGRAGRGLVHVGERLEIGWLHGLA